MSHPADCKCGCADEAKSPSGVRDLLSSIDTAKVRCSNELKTGSCKTIFRPFTDRNGEGELRSPEDDGELLLHVPFTSDCHVKSFALIVEGDTCPERVRVFKNREDLTFQLVQELQPEQEWMLQDDEEGKLEYTTR